MLVLVGEHEEIRVVDAGGFDGGSDLVGCKVVEGRLRGGHRCDNMQLVNSLGNGFGGFVELCTYHCGPVGRNFMS